MSLILKTEVENLYTLAMKFTLKSFYYTVFLFFILVKMTAQPRAVSTYDSLIAESYQKDQQIREEWDSLLANENRSNQELVDHFAKVEKIDLDNQRIVLPMLDQYIAQEIELTDASLAQLYYIIQHADGAIQSKYAPFIITLFDKELISNQEFAWFSDRLAVRKNNVQPYGFQIKSWAETAERFPYPISSQAEENCQRIDLESSKAYLEDNFGGDYLPQYLTTGEFVVFGHVKGEQNNRVIVGEELEEAAVNDKGFYVLKLKKKKGQEIRLCLKRGEETMDCKTILMDDKDWEEVDF